MAAKGRSTKGMDRPGTGPAGERNTKAVLTPEIVQQIRAEHGVPVRKLATKYGISKSQAHNIVAREQWRHI